MLLDLDLALWSALGESLEDLLFLRSSEVVFLHRKSLEARLPGEIAE